MLYDHLEVSGSEGHLRVVYTIGKSVLYHLLIIALHEVLSQRTRDEEVLELRGTSKQPIQPRRESEYLY